MSQRHSRPSPQPRPGRPKPRSAEARKARILELKAKILSGRYDADSKIEGLIEEVIRAGL